MTVTEAKRREHQAAPGPVTIEEKPRSGGGRIGSMRVGQLVVLELGALLVAVALGRPVWLLVVVATAVLALLVAAFGRRGGRWWFEYWVLSRRFRRRRQAARAALAAAGRPGLQALSPDLSVRDVTDRGTTFGVGQDSGGWFVAFEVEPGGGSPGDQGGVVDLERLATMLSEMSIPVSALQIVGHTVLAPARHMDPRVPAVQSYQELLGRAVVPANHSVWLAVRLNPSDAADAAASRGEGVAGVHRAMAAAVGRITKVLSAAGTAARPLVGDELTSVLAAVGGIAGPGDTAGLSEEWTGWRASLGTHVCFQLNGLPARPLGELIGELSRGPALSFTVSVLLTERDRKLSVRSLLHVACRADAVDTTAREAAEAARRFGAAVRRLDGEHALAVYASAPTGGGTL